MYTAFASVSLADRLPKDRQLELSCTKGAMALPLTVNGTCSQKWGAVQRPAAAVVHLHEGICSCQEQSGSHATGMPAKSALAFTQWAKAASGNAEAMLCNGQHAPTSCTIMLCW